MPCGHNLLIWELITSLLRVTGLSIGDFGFRIWDLRNPVDFIKTETSEYGIRTPQLVPRISSVQSIQSEIPNHKSKIERPVTRPTSTLVY